jgi:hypothetical protein
MERSVAMNGTDYVPTDFRISEVAWIEADTDEVIMRVRSPISIFKKQRDCEQCTLLRPLVFPVRIQRMLLTRC